MDKPQNNQWFFRLRSAVLLVTFFTGMSGLIYEVSWQRYLQNFLGSQAKASALTVAVFLGGLALGYELFGRVSRHGSGRKLLRLCGWLELGIGIWGLCFPFFYAALWQHVGILPSSEHLATVVDILVSVLLLAVPTVLMGGTLPLLTQGLSLDLDDAAPFHAAVYAVNTGGAFFGAVISGFYLLPAYGLKITLFSTAAVNITAAVVLVTAASFLPAQEQLDPRASSSADEIRESGLSLFRGGLLAFTAGFYSLSLQIILIRLVALSLGSSEYSFCIVVAVFIAMLALGAWLIAGRRQQVIPLWGNQLLAFGGAAAVYLSVSYWPYWAHVVRSLLTAVGPNFYIYYAAVFFGFALLLAVALGAMGSTMPLLFASLRSNFSQLGTRVGQLYSINTSGCVCGALFGGYYLLYYLSLEQVFRLCLLLLVLSVVLAFPWCEQGRTGLQNCRSSLLILLLGLFALGLFQLAPWDIMRLHDGLFREQSALANTFGGPQAFYEGYRGSKRVIAIKDDPNSSVSISEQIADSSSKEINDGAEIVRNMSVNGKSDGQTSLGDMDTMRLVAHLPMLLSEMPVENVAIIGFGLGVSAGSISLYPEVKQLHCVEISPTVKEFAPYFDFANYNVSVNPKLQWSLGDAYRVLGGSNQSYGIIISEPSNPWVIGVERLYAVEFYEIVKRRLLPGGIYVQWFHTYSMSKPTLATVINTFRSSFAEVRTFHSASDLIMLGRDRPFTDSSLEQMKDRFEALPQVRKALAQIGYSTVESLLAGELWLPVIMFADAPRHTLEVPRLAYAAGRDFFLQAHVPLDYVLRSEEVRPWVRRYAARALIGLWLRQSKDQLGALEEYSRKSCGMAQAGFFKSWRTASLPCQHSLIALSLLNRLNVRDEIPAGKLELLRLMLQISGRGLNWQEWKSYGDAMSFERLAALVRVFGEYDTAFVPLSVEDLLVLTGSCRENWTAQALPCNLQLINTLAVDGYGRTAQKLYEALSAEQLSLVSSERKESLSKSLKHALHAEDSIPY